MVHKVWHTTAAILWLQNLLQERFGHAFLLQLLPDCNRIAMHLPGAARCITLVLDGATFIRADSDLSCAHWNAGAEGWHTALPGELPSPGVAQLPAPLIVSTPNGVHIGYDILGLSYWMLTRQEEVGRADLDNHGRFPATASHAYKHGYLERPIVDEWLHILGRVIERTWQGIELNKHAFCMKVSHDVDFPSRYGFGSVKRLIQAMAGDLLKRGDIKNAFRAPRIRLNTANALNPADPYNTFEWIMDLSDRHGLISAFYFICGRTSNMDADYDLEHPAIRSLMRRIHQRGHEIGLHPSYGTYQTPSLITQEADRLRRIAAEEAIYQAQWGGRMHYLRWEQPITLRAWGETGMSYDSTLGYADRPGFRCGTCYEYQAFDPQRFEVIPVRLRPLIAMEVSIIDKIYLGTEGVREQLKNFIMLKENCKRVGGAYTLLWHNNNLVSKADRLLYRSVVES